MQVMRVNMQSGVAKTAKPQISVTEAGKIGRARGGEGEGNWWCPGIRSALTATPKSPGKWPRMPVVCVGTEVLARAVSC